MQAVIYKRYTKAAGLRIGDVPAPTARKGEVLVRVHAAGLNPLDWHLYQGNPWLIRGQEGFVFLKPRIPGADFAGTVEAIGEGVAGLAHGDRVMGTAGAGALAEYVTAPEGALTRIADAVSWEAAAATPVPGLTALQGLRDAGEIAQGHKVLIWGASGGVGNVAVQVARLLGARKIGAVCSGKNAQWVRELGADAVYDYTAGPVTGNASGYDLALDTVATASPRDMSQILIPGGRWVIVGAAGGGRLLGPAGPMMRRISSASRHKVRASTMLARPSSEDLATLAAWLDAGELTPRIEATYPLADAAEAYARLEAGHVAGKIVVTAS